MNEKFFKGHLLNIIMMKSKLFILFTLILILMLFPSNVFADLIVTGTKAVGFCYEISNIDDYPDYVFLLHGEPMLSYEIINPGECFSFYKLGTVSIYAVKEYNFNEDELKGKDYREVQNYFTGDPRVISSDIQLTSYGTVPENDPLEKAATILEITSLDENNLEIQKSKIIYTYTDGTSEEKDFQLQDIMPEPSRKVTLPWWFVRFWYVILPIIAIAVIALILLLRRFRR